MVEVTPYSTNSSANGPVALLGHGRGAMQEHMTTSCVTTKYIYILYLSQLRNREFLDSHSSAILEDGNPKRGTRLCCCADIVAPGLGPKGDWRGLVEARSWDDIATCFEAANSLQHSILTQITEIFYCHLKRALCVHLGDLFSRGSVMNLQL